MLFSETLRKVNVESTLKKYHSKHMKYSYMNEPKNDSNSIYILFYVSKR